jgi:hypothetical protein
MAGNGTETKELTPKQTRAIVAILSTKDLGTAAKVAAVGERTLYSWLDDPAFREALHKAEDKVIEAATTKLICTSQEALTVIVSIMQDEEAPASVRLRAAQTVLDQMIKLRLLGNLAVRVNALEQRLVEEAELAAASGKESASTRARR